MSDEKSEFEFDPIDISDFAEAPETLPATRDVELPEPIDDDTDRTHDYGEVRKTYFDLVARGQEALENLMMVAQQSEHPRAYEVVAQLIKTISDTNEKIMATHDTVEKIRKQELENKSTKEEGTGKTVTNNAIFVGTMNDFQKMIKKATGEDHSERQVN